MNSLRMHPLHIQGTFLLGSLILQYLLGMYVNLFVAFPDNLSGGQLWEFAWTQPALIAHIIVAFLLVIAAIVLCIRSARMRDTRWIWAAFIGLIAILAALYSGASFVPSQADQFSYGMSVFFLIAFVSYAWAVFSTRSDVLVKSEVE